MERRGFSLIELIIVLSILGILAGTVVPIYMNLENEARSSQSQATLGAVRSAISIYYAKNNGTFPSLIELPNLFVGRILPTPIISSDSTKNLNTVVLYLSPGPSADIGGWMYDETLGKIVINSNAVDPVSMKQWCSY